jgi:hypothetical protein
VFAEAAIHGVHGNRRGTQAVDFLERRDVRQFVERINEDDRQERLQTLTFKQSKKTWRFEGQAA